MLQDRVLKDSSKIRCPEIKEGMLLLCGHGPARVLNVSSTVVTFDNGLETSIEAVRLMIEDGIWFVTGESRRHV